MSHFNSQNPLLSLDFIPAFESLGEDYSDLVGAANFPMHTLRWRNDDLLAQVGLAPDQVSDDQILEAFGRFEGRSPFLAMRYHGYQFGEYNPYLGDGRGFLYGQVRGNDGCLYDFGTKGTGPTPYSRGGDGRLTLKGGVREVIAAEALHQYGVRTSRCLSVVETGEKLGRGDEPSPARSSVMIRMSHSHIRFGTFERLHYIQRPDLIKVLLDHVIEYYYPHLLQEADEGERYGLFFTELVERVATLAAQWMTSGFCHAVLNTDNMSITGESFDYGPYAFMERFDPRFTAAYFDYSGRYCYANQPNACQWNLEMLRYPLKMVMSSEHLQSGLDAYQSNYDRVYQQRMINRLGFASLPPAMADDLLTATLTLLSHLNIGYHDFFLALRQLFTAKWRESQEEIALDILRPESDDQQELVHQWRSLYYQAIKQYGEDQMDAIAQRLGLHNPDIVPIRPEIETIWDPIVADDNWQPFLTLMKRIQQSVVPLDT
ncbi:MAG: YdiU family protein [Cyanobacteria bacterium P01_F01_bin.150]